MKHKEINLSSVSLEKAESFEKKVLESDEKEPKVEVKKKKLSFKEKIKKPFQNFAQWWKKAPKHKKILVVTIPALLLLGGSAFFFYYTIYGPRNRPPELFSISTNYISPQNSEMGNLRFLTLSKPSVPRTEESPINGKLFTREEMEKLKKRRPIAAMINNHIEARPTSNLTQADLVYEALVEGGITRLLAIYWSKEPNKIGPIRSARQYYLEWLSPFDALYIYDGFATSSDPKVNAGGNISSYGIKSIYTRGAWRVSDRVAPHNEYSSTVKTWEYAKTQNWDQFPEVDSWKFKSDASNDERGEKFKAKVSISNSDQYNSVWEYNRATNMYLRSIGGIKDIDLETNQQISAKNVIIQEVKVEGPVDQYSRLIITTTGSGNVAILQDGKIVYGTWKKADRLTRTKFYDNSGNEIVFNRGLTWIATVRQLQGNFDIIEQ